MLSLRAIWKSVCEPIDPTRPTYGAHKVLCLENVESRAGTDGGLEWRTMKSTVTDVRMFARSSSIFSAYLAMTLMCLNQIDSVLLSSHTAFQQAYPNILSQGQGQAEGGKSYTFVSSLLWTTLSFNMVNVCIFFISWEQDGKAAWAFHWGQLKDTDWSLISDPSLDTAYLPPV